MLLVSYQSIERSRELEYVRLRMVRESVTFVGSRLKCHRLALHLGIKFVLGSIPLTDEVSTGAILTLRLALVALLFTPSTSAGVESVSPPALDKLNLTGNPFCFVVRIAFVVRVLFLNL